MVRLSYKLTLEAWFTLPGASEKTSPYSDLDISCSPYHIGTGFNFWARPKEMRDFAQIRGVMGPVANKI